VSNRLNPLKMDASNEVSSLESKYKYCNRLNPLKIEGSNEER
jgi:hypothetical protein